MLNRVPAEMDKSEGSLIYDALAPAAAEISQMYLELDAILRETFADTASINYLARRAAEHGVERLSATKAVFQARLVSADMVPIGTRFRGRELTYAVVSAPRFTFYYDLECETAGTEGNQFSGEIVPIDYLPGLQSAELEYLTVPARDAETLEELRERFFQTVQTSAYGGSIADYKRMTKAIPDAVVAACKVTPHWNGGGTVKVTILDGAYRAAGATLVGHVQRALDPEPQGEGRGLAPIGHTVTVESAVEEAITVYATLTLETGWKWEQIEDAASAAVDDYFEELRRNWENSDHTVVRTTQIVARFLNIEGILDAQVSLSGTTAFANRQLDGNRIPVNGGVQHA